MHFNVVRFLLGSCFATGSIALTGEDTGSLLRQRTGYIQQLGDDALGQESACSAFDPCVRQYGLLLNSSLEPAVNFGPETPKHKDLLPLDFSDIISWIVVSITLFIAAGGGIGGGGVLVPLYILCLQFETEHAVALSNLTIAGGAVANLFCNVHRVEFGNRRHPYADRPLIDWNLILVMEPMTIVGAVGGSMLNKILPLWLTTILLCALLCFMAAKLWRKGIAIFETETMRSTQRPDMLELSEDDGHGEAQEVLLDNGMSSANKSVIDSIMASGECVGIAPNNYPTEREPLYAAVRRIIESEKHHVPLGNLIILVGLFLWILISGILKDEVACGSWLYWLLVLSVVPLVAGIMMTVRGDLLQKGELKRKVGLVPEQGDIEWTPRTSLTYPAACSLAGVVAGMFGVGGGIVKGPLMLHMGMLPDVAAATSATMILFTSCSASVVYITFGGIKWDYAVVLMVTGFVVTLLGQMLTYYVIATFGRRSIIVLAMATLLSVGAAIMIYESGAAIVAAARDGWLVISSICS